jgi:hypothetical protein
VNLRKLDPAGDLLGEIMQDIDIARTIRAAVLSQADASWEHTVFEGVQHQCWRVEGDGWQAVLSNLWDVMSAPGRVTATEYGDRHHLIERTLLEVFDEVDDEQPVLGMSYGETPQEDHLFVCNKEACQRLFKRELISARAEFERRNPRSTIIFSTAFAA